MTKKQGDDTHTHSVTVYKFAKNGKNGEASAGSDMI